MIHNKQRRIICIAGKTGGGKSHYVKHEIIPHLTRYVIFDLMEEYEPYGSIVFNDLEDFREFVVDNVENDIFKIVCRFEDQEDYETGFEIVNFMENCYCVIEEISNFASPHAYSPTLEKVIRFGRHKSTSIIGVTQRICDCGPLLLNNCDLIVCYSLTDANDLKRLRQTGCVGKRYSEVAQLSGHEKILFFNN